jgi:hypothetical protein
VASIGWLALGVALIAGATGCGSAVPPAALRLPPTTLQERQIQTRRFATPNEATIQQASAQVLQDLGFQIEESESRLGLIVASKTRDASVASRLLRTVLPRVLPLPTDRLQQIRASLATRPAGSAVAVRITFQCLVRDRDSRLSTVAAVRDPAIYQEFFDRLSQSVFLAAQGL